MNRTDYYVYWCLFVSTGPLQEVSCVDFHSIPPGEVYEYSVCSDCLYYAEYGCLDDWTMMEIEDSEEE
jgi:hypothetical protein